MKKIRPHHRFTILVLGILLSFCGTSSLAQTLSKSVVRRTKTSSRPVTQVLVKFRDGLASGPRAMAAAGYASKGEIAALRVQVIAVPSGRSADEVMAEIRQRYGAELTYAEPNRIRYAVHTPNDPGFSQQYHLSTIGCPTAWDSTTGTGIIIAIADTGVTPTHPDLAAHLLPGFNVVENNVNVTDIEGHGTAVAGTAAAIGDDGYGVAGVAYNATILPVRISTDTDGSSDDATIAAAILYAADQGAKVINISFNSDAPAPAGCWSQTVIDAAAYMRSKGGSVVIAAGNGGNDQLGDDKGCSNNAEIIDVAATDEQDLLATFSNFGSELDVSAPGVNIITTNMDPAFVSIADGTSFAAPITAGVLALIYAVDPTFTPAQAEQILFDSALDLGPGGYDTSFGWGRVNASNAVAIAQERSVLFQLQRLTNVYAYPNPWDARRHTNRQVTIANVPDTATVNIFTLSGFWVKKLTPSNGRAVWEGLTNSAGDTVASGLYFYLVTSGDNTARGTIAIIK